MVQVLLLTFTIGSASDADAKSEEKAAEKGRKALRENKCPEKGEITYS
jgi:hypothetical protein